MQAVPRRPAPQAEPKMSSRGRKKTLCVGTAFSVQQVSLCLTTGEAQGKPVLHVWLLFNLEKEHKISHGKQKWSSKNERPFAPKVWARQAAEKRA